MTRSPKAMVKSRTAIGASGGMVATSIPPARRQHHDAHPHRCTRADAGADDPGHGHQGDHPSSVGSPMMPCRHRWLDYRAIRVPTRKQPGAKVKISWGVKWLPARWEACGLREDPMSGGTVAKMFDRCQHPVTAVRGRTACHFGCSALLAVVATVWTCLWGATIGRRLRWWVRP
jgi:hypothetical protein